MIRIASGPGGGHAFSGRGVTLPFVLCLLIAGMIFATASPARAEEPPRELILRHFEAVNLRAAFALRMDALKAGLVEKLEAQAANDSENGASRVVLLLRDKLQSDRSDYYKYAVSSAVQVWKKNFTREELEALTGASDTASGRAAAARVADVKEKALKEMVKAGAVQLQGRIVQWTLAAARGG